jgi:hypothetical protein
VRPRGGSPRAIALAAAALTAALLLAGCAPTEPTEPSQTSAPSETATASATPTPSPTPTPTPELVPEGSAADNLPLFKAVTAKVWRSSHKAQGRAYIDALVAAGFDKSDMQVTQDTSTVGNPAESIQFAVRWGEECLVGQVGPATGRPVTTVLPGLPGGACLIGETRPIDW